MKKYVSMVLGAALSFMSSVDAYISERDIAYTSAIMKNMDANFVDAFVLWRGDFIGKMRKKGNIQFALHEPGRSLIDARNEGNDAVMKLLVALFPSNNGTLEISTTADSNFAKAMRSLSVKTQAQIIAKLLTVCKTISNTGNANGLDVKQLSKQVSDQIAKMIDWTVVTRADCKLAAVRDAIKRMASMVCASSAFEKRVEIYKKHITESLILGFCCFNFDGLVGVRTLLNAFAEEGLIDTLDDDLQDVTQDKYLENIKKLIADYKEKGNIEPLLAECEATDLFGSWISYEKFQSIFKEKVDSLKDQQKKINDLKKNKQAEKKEIKKASEDLNKLITELVDAEIPGLNTNLRDELIAFLKKFDWNKGIDFINDSTWKNKGFSKYFGKKISKQEFIDFCKENDSDKILSKINETVEGQAQLPILNLLARFYSNYSERVDEHRAELEAKIKDYMKKRNGLRGYNVLYLLRKLAEKTEKISTEDLLIFSAGKPSSLVPYPTTGDFEQNLDVKINGKSFADCVETTVRHLISMMCEYDSKTNTIKVPDNFNELTKKFFEEYGDKVSSFNARSAELHTAWVEMLNKIPDWANIEHTNDGDLESSSENIKNTLAFLTTSNQAEYKTQKEKNLIDILNNGRGDATFSKGSSSSRGDKTIVLRKNGEKQASEKFVFVLSVSSGHSCLKGPDDSNSSTFAYEISDTLNDTGRLYVSSLAFPNQAGMMFLRSAQENIERPFMYYFLEKATTAYDIEDTVKYVLSKIKGDVENADNAKWLKSMIESDKARDIVSVAQSAVDNTSDDTISSVVKQITDKIGRNPLSVSDPEAVARDVIDGLIASLKISKEAIANIIVDACSKVIEDEDEADSFKSSAKDSIEDFEKKTSYEVFRDIVDSDEYDVKSAVVTEENLKNCGVDVNNANAIVAACNTIKAVVLSSSVTEYRPIDISYMSPDIFVALDMVRQNHSDLFECFGIDLMDEKNVEKVIKGYLNEISNCDDNARSKLLGSLQKFTEALESSSKKIVVSAQSFPKSKEEAGFLIGLNQVKHVDVKLFESLNKVLALKIDGNEVSLTDKACSKVFLKWYLYNLAGSKTDSFSKLKSEMAELVNELGSEKVEISLSRSGLFSRGGLEPYANFILASLKLIENDSELLEKLENILVLKDRNGNTSIKSALSRHFNAVKSYLEQDGNNSCVLENLKNVAGV